MSRAGVFIGVDQTGGLQRLNDAAAGARRMHAWAVSQGMPDKTHARLITDESGKVSASQISWVPNVEASKGGNAPECSSPPCASVVAWTAPPSAEASTGSWPSTTAGVSVSILIYP